MKDMKNDPLAITTIHAVKGGLTGLVCATAFYYLISGLSSVLPAVSGAENGMPPLQIAMMAGSVFGAIFGGIVGLRKSR